MTDVERDELLGRLKELMSMLPEVRLGQLLANLAVVARGTAPGAIYDLEDEELLTAINWQLDQLASRHQVELAGS
jgi:hypothetical protein